MRTDPEAGAHGLSVRLKPDWRSCVIVVHGAEDGGDLVVGHFSGRRVVAGIKTNQRGKFDHLRAVDAQLGERRNADGPRNLAEFFRYLFANCRIVIAFRNGNAAASATMRTRSGTAVAANFITSGRARAHRLP